MRSDDTQRGIPAGLSQTHEGLTSTLLSISNSTTITLAIEKAMSRFRGSFSPSASRQ